jgi:hypothetical protein
LSKFTNLLSSNVIFRSNLHHIQMDATQFSCYHGVLVQFSGLKFAPHISGCNPTFLLPQGVDTIFKSNLHHIQMDATQLSCCTWGVDEISRYDFNHMQMYAIQLACCHGVLNAWLA